MLICPFLNNLLWTSLIPTTYKRTTIARAFELQWNILHFISSIGIIVGTFIGEAWLDEEEAKFKEIQWDYQRAGPSFLLLVLHNTRNKLHHREKKLVGTLEEYQCGDCYKFAEKIINSLWVAGESYK